jgi:tetratricopeptide (TPR) repeat protein
MSIIASHVRAVVEAVICEIEGLNVPQLDCAEVPEANTYGARLAGWWTTDGDRSRTNRNFFTGGQTIRVGGPPPPPAWKEFLPEGFTFEPGQNASQDTVFDYLDAMYAFAEYSFEQGGAESCANICKELVQRLEQISGGRCERSKVARNLLGEAYHNIGAGREALEPGRKALEQFCTLILHFDEPGDEDELMHAVNLAGALHATEHFDLAKRIFQAALDDIDRDAAAHAGEDHEMPEAYETIVQNLAGIHSEMGNNAEAEQLFLRILPRESWYKPQADARELSMLRNIALLLQRQAKHGEALELYASVAQRRATLLGAYHPATQQLQRDIAICRAELAAE